MHQPLFVQTSVGFINLALVRHVTQNKRCMSFCFSRGQERSDFIELPVDEGQRIIRALVSERPDLFLVA